MNPTATNARGENSHSYPAYDYPVGIGTGLVAVKSGVIRDMPGQPTRAIMSPLRNGQAWPNAGGGAPNSGNVICIDHGNGEFTAYLHCSPFDVNAMRGRRVKQGEVFAQSGNNGWSTGPHLHFEVWRNGNRIDPGPWLASIKKEGSTEMPDDGTIDNVFLLINGRPASGQELKDFRKSINDPNGIFYNKIATDYKNLQKFLADAEKARDSATGIANMRADRLNEIAKLVGAKDGDDFDTIVSKIKSGTGVDPTVLGPGLYEVPKG